MGDDRFQFIHTALADRRHTDRLRSLTPLIPIDATQVLKQTKPLINFSSNDYLGLAKHPALIDRAIHYSQRYGTSATASRLVAGTYDIHSALEDRLAAAVGQESALLFGTGFQANLTILPCLADRQSLILCDRLVHNSLLQGIQLSGATFRRYRHNDLDALETALQSAQTKPYNRILIVSETLFSMDGDRSDVPALMDLAQGYGAILYLDDAHALGVLGPNGMGLAAHQPGVDLVVGTFGKAMGSFGAFVACSRSLRDYLINTCPGVIYTTALPPSVIGAVDAALDLIPNMGADRQRLQDHSTLLRTKLNHIGYDTAGSTTHIVPAIVGGETEALALAAGLEERGFLAIAIRPPTVPIGSARLRFTLSSAHSTAQIEALALALDQALDQALGSSQ
jgi:8-amino-7-oxononanoate synthase